MPEDAWAALADAFVDGAYATVKGRVRTFVVHQQLLRHLPAAPATVLDVGGGAAHQSLPLARAGYDVVLLDSSPAMLERAQQRLAQEPEDVRQRVRLVHGEAESAGEAVDGRTFDAVLCHGVLMYLDDPAPVLAELCERVAPGGLLSLLALNAQTLAVRPALERRWADALQALDATRETGVLGTPTRGDTVQGLTATLQGQGVEPVDWHGVWLFTDWLDLPDDDPGAGAVAELELQASLRDPYRQLSRVFHLLGRKR